jgi:hypothetical protein
VCSLFKQRAKSLHLSDLTTPQASSSGSNGLNTGP